MKRMIVIGSIAAVLIVAACGLLIAMGQGRYATARTQDTPAAIEEPISVDTTSPEVQATPDPTASPAALARIRFAGDIIIDSPMLKAAYTGGTYKFGKYFALIADELADADLTIANIEGAIAGQGTLGYTGYPSFNTPPSILDALKASGVDMLTLANNHALDRYFDGLMNTLRNVDKADLLRTGAYRSQKEHDAPLVVDVNGIKIGFTNYTTGLNGVEKRSDKRATQYGVRTVQRSDFAADIEALRNAGAQAVVVLMHWDREYKSAPSGQTRAYAQQLADAGADVIIGGHPHRVQPAEWLTGAAGNRTLCLYSLGNFLSNHQGAFVDNGILFDVSFALGDDGAVRVVDPKYIPVWVWVHKSGDKLNYQVVPTTRTLSDRPEEMTDEQYARMEAAREESAEVMGVDVATPQ